MYILGINGVYHDTAAALLANGQIIAAAEEERFTRQKHAKWANPYNSWELPLNAIDYCLSEAGITINEVDHVAYSFRPWQRVWNAIPLIASRIRRGRFKQLVREAAYLWFTRTFVSSLLACARHRRMWRLLVYESRLPFRVHFVEHHIAHAASAFFTSPFEEAAILSIDGTGELVSTLLAQGIGNRILKLKELKRQNSLGFLYEEMTGSLGFTKNEDEYKVMALSSFGQPSYMNDLHRLVETFPDGTFRNKIEMFEANLFGPIEIQAIPGFCRLWGAPIETSHRNAAASAQRLLEEVVLNMSAALRERTRSANLCLAGGVSLNCLLNEKLLQRAQFANVYVQPASHDAGTALGAALWVNCSFLKQDRSCGSTMTHAFWGPSYSDEQIRERLDRHGVKYRQSEDVAEEAARLLSAGQVVAWFQGRMEWGPRALGARSLLGSPCDCSIHNLLNSMKGREPFQPYAASVLESKASEWFEFEGQSRFMAFAKSVRLERRRSIPAVVHVDGTCRVQTVDMESNPLFHRLLSNFEALSGIPVLLNTSFNRKAEPIVCTPDDALACYFVSPLKYLVIGSFVLEK